MTKAPTSGARKKSARVTSGRLVARSIGLDRFAGQLRVSGWAADVEGVVEAKLAIEGDDAPPTIAVLKFDRRTSMAAWALKRAVPRALGPDRVATLSLVSGAKVLDELSFELALAEDVTEPLVAVSRVTPDPAADRLRAVGWAYRPGGGEVVAALFDGQPIASVEASLRRPDLAAGRPLLGRVDLGWSLDVEIQGLAERLMREPKPLFEVRLADPRPSPSARSAAVAYDGDLSAAIGRRERLKTARSRAAKAPVGLLDGLVASRAFARRWSADPAGEAFAMRRIAVDELISRDAVTGERVICLSSGDRVHADPGRDRVMARAFLLDGAYERGFLDWIESVVKPGDAAIDVGVAYGVVSLALARRGARVFSVEANPEMVRLAARNVALNGADGVTLVNKAASDRKGRITFASVPQMIGSSRIIPNASHVAKQRFLDEISGLGTIALRKDAIERRYGTEDLFVETVEATTLDALCEAHGLRDVAVVKIDIEGAELLALRGAKKLLDGQFGAPPVVALEYSRLVPLMGGTPEDVFAEFAGRGWSVHVQKNGKSRGGPLVRLDSAADAPDHDNIICLPPES